MSFASEVYSHMTRQAKEAVKAITRDEWTDLAFNKGITDPKSISTKFHLPTQDQLNILVYCDRANTLGTFDALNKGVLSPEDPGADSMLTNYYKHRLSDMAENHRKFGYRYAADQDGFWTDDRGIDFPVLNTDLPLVYNPGKNSEAGTQPGDTKESWGGGSNSTTLGKARSMCSTKEDE